MVKDFIIKTLPKDLEKYKKQEITMCFKSSKHKEDLEFFNQDGRYFCTFSSMITKEIDKANYQKAIKNPDGRLVKKIRYTLPIPKNGSLSRATELYADVYEGDLEGLTILELHAPGAKNFRRPKWLGADISKNSNFSAFQLTHGDPHYIVDKQKEIIQNENQGEREL